MLMSLLLAACNEDETISGYADSAATYILTEIDQNPFSASATLRFPEAGKISGRAPCNRYFAEQELPYPWFKVGPIGATKMACPALRAEQSFFDAIRAMTLVEVSGGVLVLSNEDGREMVFKTDP